MRVLIRQVHFYVGVTIAPSVLFFCVTGALQLFRLHEAHGDYRPPPIVEKLGMLHKDQLFELKRRPPPKPAATGPQKPAAPPKDRGTPTSATVLKWFFLLVASGLFTSTCVGVWMALLVPTRRRLVLGLLAVGAALPVLLLQL